MTNQKLIIIISSILLFTIYSCSKNDLANTIKAGDSIISTGNYSLDNNGQLNFKCFVTNASDQNTPELPAKINYFYSTFGNSNTTLYDQMSGTIISTAPNMYSVDSMHFPSLGGNCCNTCCPGTYTCEIKVYSPDMTTVIDQHTTIVDIDNAGFNVKK